MVAFWATHVSAADEFGATVVTFAESGRGGEYLMFQRERDEHAADGFYVERRGQGWAVRGGVRHCALYRNRLNLSVDESAARRLGGASEFEVTFDLPDERFVTVREHLRAVFREQPCFADRSDGERRAIPPPDAFAESLDRLFANWFGSPARPGDGYSHDDVRDWESYHGLTLPAPLRTYYLRLGENKLLRLARGMFVLPDFSEVSDDRAVFWTEHDEDRDGAWCGIAREALALPDPPVERQVFLNDDESIWLPECQRLSWFVLRSMCWQAAWGLPVRSVARLTPAGRDRLATGLALVAPGESLENEIVAYSGDGLAVCEIPTEGLVRIGARDADRLAWLKRELGVEAHWL